MPRSLRSAIRLGALALVVGATAMIGVRTFASASQPFARFDMIASPGISSCLPNAVGHVTIVSQGVVEVMRLDVSGLPANTDFDFFVTELPNKPFGVAWYQSDLETNSHGEGHVTVVGRFNIETFSVSTGGPTTTFPPTHMYHLGLWFNDPQVPFNLGCEPGKTEPVVTPFNGEQHAGIQVLNTANFPDNAGPLSQVQ
ncbi:MAG TPA: hypothetical protein VKV26_21495 [Dehalococcoidia bacterium]|nr:hypothetical protein [Dehalococcoidia bacterium]